MFVTVESSCGKYILLFFFHKKLAEKESIALYNKSFSGDFECDLDQPDPTLLDLKNYLDEDEIGVLPERQRIFYMGYEITDDNLKINDIVGTFGANNFSLILTKAKESPIKLPNQRFLITG